MHLGFASNLQRSGPGPQFGSQQPGPPMSPHPSPGGPMHHSVGSYQQGGPGYGPQGGQYGPSGNILSHLHLLLHSHYPHIFVKNFGRPLKMNPQIKRPACGHVASLSWTGKRSIMCVIINRPSLRSHNVTELPSVSD